ncbi:MAG: FHA domain-containing protein [gamma proteobacterium symbiont of Bathyaustriella thionipta]|nr:FHA domain-containing protein [gamma proteobacterium symbiont of Bathyaustriella thionipta]MCU7950676.1 FHA domain-containing protein [gamma proteobacterium symbiont of Bathyaustriella thionipta]MCU7952903.1 FHA domain-containing protein [gamma proteobacterium symbiont of Bathyaustriella thionipta]MCU7957178.1 FHA domain-containing protein [gamma proteobacterium symbiont of Bathyaustriella thionipta]
MRLVLKFDGQEVQEFVLEKGSISIGRTAKNDIVIDNLAVSGIHAIVHNTDNGAVLEDMKSTNGTFVNDKKVHHHNLKDGDIINVGKHQILFYTGATFTDSVESCEQSEATVMMSADFQQQLQKELSKKKTAAPRVAVKKPKEVSFWGKFMKVLGFS